MDKKNNLTDRELLEERAKEGVKKAVREFGSLLKRLATHDQTS